MQIDRLEKLIDYSTFGINPVSIYTKDDLRQMASEKILADEKDCNNKHINLNAVIAVKRTRRYLLQQMYKEKTVNLPEKYDVKDKFFDKDLLMDLKTILNDYEIIVIIMRLKRYKMDDIANKLNLSEYKFRCIYRQLKNKLKDYFEL
jgi:hypothetical protein